MKKIEKYLEKKFKIDASYYLRGGFWNTLAHVLVIIGGIASTSILARVLTESDYGFYRYLIGIGALLSTFSLTGLGLSILQTSAKKYYSFYLDTIRTNYLYSLGITAAGFVGATYYFFNDNPTLAAGCILIALFQPVINVYQNVLPFLHGTGRFRESTIIQTFKTIFVSSATIAAVFITQNVIVLLGVYLITNALSNYVSFRYFKPSLSGENISKEEKGKYLNYAKHTSAQAILNGIAFRLDTIVIFTQLGAAEVALYTVASIIPEQIKGFFKNLTTLVIPKFAQHSDPSITKKQILRRAPQLFLVFIVITILYITAAPYLINLLFPKYPEAVFLSQLLALSFPASIAILPMSAIQSRLKNKELHQINIYTSFLLIVFTVTLTLFYGVLGAVMAKIFSRYSNFAISYYYLSKMK